MKIDDENLELFKVVVANDAYSALESMSRRVKLVSSKDMAGMQKVLTKHSKDFKHMVGNNYTE